jgi:predicted CXXCH cytochrome family protein
MLHLQKGIVRLAMSKHQAKSEVQRVKTKDRHCEGQSPEAISNEIPRYAQNDSKVFYALCSTLIALCFVLILALSDFGYAQVGIKGKIPDLCYECHKQLKESLSQSYVHFPFKQGKCEVCHNVHSSDRKNLMKDDVNSVCLSCHEGIRNFMSKGTVHGALKKGVCTDCHSSHAGMNKLLLVKEEKKLCWDCHEALKEQFNKSHVHTPFKEGACSSCHNAHASPEGNLLLASPNKICKTCHQPRCTAASVSIFSITKDLDCNTCHTGHSSDSKGLLGPYGHTSFLNESCEQCHNPIATGVKITTKLSGKELCFSCHAEERTMVNEADVHEGDKKGCTLCHDYHASMKKNLTVKESDFCFSCHQDTEKRQLSMVKALRSIRCEPVRDNRCFECHVPVHSHNPLYFREDNILTCARCHKAEHKVAHPMGKGVLDPRDGKPITCITCHSMHSAKADFMLYLDRKRALCIQCHKR